MDENIYKFIFYLLFFASFESSGQLMFIDCFEEGQFVCHENADPGGHVGIGNFSMGFTFFTTAQFGDLVFNELMADPTPVVKLPGAEFIELKNTSGSPINIRNWILEVNGRQKELPDKTIPPGGFLILGGTGGQSVWGGYGENIEVPGLVIANDGVIIRLFAAANVLVDSFSYKPAMHRKGFSGGGYSLERIDPLRRCGVASNWETSTSVNGGTPGTENAVFRDNPDHIPPVVNSVTVASPVLLEIVVSEIPDLSVVAGTIFSYVPALPVPDSIRFDYALKKYSVYFPAGAIKNGISYELTVDGLKDECGNKSPVDHREFWYFLPEKGDLLISEVLFNPFPGGVDFVEIYNNSGRKVELKELFLASLDNDHKIKMLYPLSETSEILMDAQYAAFTSDAAVLLANYFSDCHDCIFELGRFPAYNLDEGWVVLVNREMEILDEFHYFERMHHPMIGDVKGISLERSSFSKSSHDPVNWHSASKTVGYATPGYRNSAYENLAEASEMVTFGPKVFSPNEDGYNDRLSIHLSPGEPGWMVNIRIYNESGLEIRRLANNLMIGTRDIVEWDGTTENHRKADLGIYILKVELFGLQTRRKLFKGACVITDRLE